tara:strand:- start:204 stop:1187 length:984 start_codon:yes stop_codon:yes gene_type:complete
MANGIKYQAHEILNKVLNSAETGLQVDIVSGAEYAEDSAHTSADTGNFILGVRNDTLAALGGADGDYVPFQMNASGALYVEVATLPASTSTIEVVGDAAENAAAAGNPVLIGGRYDSSGRTLGNGDVGAIALDADGAVHIADGGNTITVDGTVTANLSATDNAVLDAMVVDLAAMETLLTAANVDHAANEVLLTGIDADTDAIKTDMAAIEVLLTAANVDHAANEALLTTIDSDTNDIKTATESSNTHLGNMFYDTAAAVTPHDTNDLSGEPYYAVWVGTGGNLKVDMSSGTGTVTLNNVASGQLLPIMVERIYSTGTTASDIIVFK